MRRAVFALAALLHAGCSPFSEASTPAVTEEDAGVDAATADAGADAASKRFCPVSGALFCSDFEEGALIQEWLPESATPKRFLTLAPSPDHGNVLLTTLDANSAAAGRQVILARTIKRPASVTYALDLRVDQHSTSQSVEVASLRTASATVTTAFHVVIGDGDLLFAEFAKASATPYKSSTLGVIDGAWHRIEVSVFYEPAIEVAVRVDGNMIIARRPISVGPAAPPTNDVVLSVGANDVTTVTGPLSYMIDNVTLSSP